MLGAASGYRHAALSHMVVSRSLNPASFKTGASKDGLLKSAIRTWLGETGMWFWVIMSAVAVTLILFGLEQIGLAQFR